MVGLGVTGAGVALDAASRGLSVLAVDAHDLAFGTSRWSSKLVHGGLRYLAHGQVGVAHESAVERGILMTRTAPHLTRALPMLLPLPPGVTPPARPRSPGPGSAPATRSARRARTPRDGAAAARRLNRTEALALAPGCAATGCAAALLSWDGQLEDDARLVVAIARTAAAHGARVLTRARVTELAGDGAMVRDELTGAEPTIRARAVVNAAGVWAGKLVPGVRLRPVTRHPPGAARQRLPGPARRRHGAGARPRQPVRVRPAAGRRPVYFGLTDEPVDGPVPDVPEPSETEIGFLLDIIGARLRAAAAPRRRGRRYAGLRPLLDAGGGVHRRPVAASRGARVARRCGDGRRRQAHDLPADGRGRRRRRTARGAASRPGPCRTGTCLWSAPPTARASTRSRRRKRLVRRYGTEASRCSTTPRGRRVRRARAARADRRRRARHRARAAVGTDPRGRVDVDDLLDRRTRIGLVPPTARSPEPMARRALELVESRPVTH